MTNEVVSVKVLKHSILGIISFALAISGMVLYGLTMLLSRLMIISMEISQFIMSLCLSIWLISLIIGVIDLFKKNRRKILPVIAVTISFLPLLLFTLIVAFITFIQQVST